MTHTYHHNGHNGKKYIVEFVSDTDGSITDVKEVTIVNQLNQPTTTTTYLFKNKSKHLPYSESRIMDLLCKSTDVGELINEDRYLKFGRTLTEQEEY